RVWFEGSPGIPAQLPDHAALGLALIALHDFAPDHSSGNRWLAHAKASADVIRNSFGTVEDGYRMTQTPDGISGYIQVDDVEIPSGNAMALALFARLTKRLQAPLIEQDGFRLAAALSGLAINIPAQRGSALKAIQELQTGETGRVRFAGSGAVRAAMTQTFDKITVDLTIADGWHVNAHDPLEDYLIATDLTVHGQLAHPIDYPAPTIKSLSFSDAPLALYEGDLRLEAHVSPGAVHQIDLTLQACSDRVCLQPETLTFVLWPPVQ
ncbi:MAG: protein-disulfide reductase DsbD domain-containing protein, partial [Parasphingorhabdus sp.]|uniref:protein-disulfide reductase DsbD domain-containing protein n=1 Tax=Parasphingorhabdus sp. TaxID=2709688 RepID=UPI00329744E6